MYDFEEYPDEVLDAAAKFDPADNPYGSEKPILEGLS